ncbi:MAG: hypothetical protein R2864_04840 [Syntrophotaleaceae bacterium]
MGLADDGGLLLPASIPHRRHCRSRQVSLPNLAHADYLCSPKVFHPPTLRT